MTKFNRNIPYNSLPILPPTTNLETTKVLRKTINASRALAKLNGMLTNLPNATLFLDTIHLQEAKASSEIENIITTNDDLYRSLVADKKFDNPATKEVISYKEYIKSIKDKDEREAERKRMYSLAFLSSCIMSSSSSSISRFSRVPSNVTSYLFELVPKSKAP